MIVKKFATGFIIGSIALNAVVPMFAATEVTISGNGADSFNKVKVGQYNSSKLIQSSKTVANISINAVANTGGNTANKNTGGEVAIDTGDVGQGVAVAVVGGSNTAEDSCGCVPEDTTVDIHGNGADSDNIVKIKKSNHSFKLQKSKTYANIGVNLVGNTGENKANKNTGSGVDVTTGDVETGVEVVVEGGNNSL